MNDTQVYCFEKADTGRTWCGRDSYARGKLIMSSLGQKLTCEICLNCLFAMRGTIDFLIDDAIEQWRKKGGAR